MLNAHKASREAGVYLVFANYVPAEHGGNDNIYVETQTCTQDSGLADSTAAKLGSIPGAIRSGVTKESGGYRPWALLPGEMKYCK